MKTGLLIVSTRKIEITIKKNYTNVHSDSVETDKNYSNKKFSK